MERLFVDVEIEINRTSTTTNKKSEKANHEFLHFSLFSLTLQMLHHKNGNFLVLLYYLTPLTQIGYKSCCGNFSQPM